LGKQAFLSKDSMSHKALTLTLSVSSDGLEQIIACLRQLKLEITSIVTNEKNKPDNVYQLNIHIFPLTK
jgi:uncharacterized protein (TIGR02147 family)